MNLENPETKNEYDNDDDTTFATTSDEKDTYNPISKMNRVEENPQNFNAIQLKNFLSNFFLIKTPWGYVLGRNYRPMTQKSNSRKLKRNSLNWPNHQGKLSKFD